MHMIAVGERLINGDAIAYVECGSAYTERVSGLHTRYEVVRVYFIGAGSYKPLELSLEEGGAALLAVLRTQ